MSLDRAKPYGWKSLDATEAHSYLWPAIKRALNALDITEARVLDIGCGNGYVASRMHELGFRVTGVDASPDGIELARQKYNGIRFEVTSAYDNVGDLLGEREFDVVVSSEVIEHLYHPRKLLKLAHAMLRDKGALIVTTPYHGYWKNLALSLANKWDDHHTVEWDGGHIKFFSEVTLAKMLRESGFSAVRFSNGGRIPWLWKSMVCVAFRS